MRFAFLSLFISAAAAVGQAGGERQKANRQRVSDLEAAAEAAKAKPVERKANPEEAPTQSACQGAGFVFCPAPLSQYTNPSNNVYGPATCSTRAGPYLYFGNTCTIARIIDNGANPTGSACVKETRIGSFNQAQRPLQSCSYYGLGITTLPFTLQSQGQPAAGYSLDYSTYEILARLPTSGPTTFPTTRPPTNQPTNPPTTTPPTAHPTTQAPTTASPTATPTDAPTDGPTGQPWTERPVNSPTDNPTSPPTNPSVCTSWSSAGTDCNNGCGANGIARGAHHIHVAGANAETGKCFNCWYELKGLFSSCGGHPYVTQSSLLGSQWCNYCAAKRNCGCTSWSGTPPPAPSKSPSTNAIGNVPQNSPVTVQAFGANTGVTCHSTAEQSFYKKWNWHDGAVWYKTPNNMLAATQSDNGVQVDSHGVICTLPSDIADTSANSPEAIEVICQGDENDANDVCDIFIFQFFKADCPGGDGKVFKDTGNWCERFQEAAPVIELSDGKHYAMKALRRQVAAGTTVSFKLSRKWTLVGAHKGIKDPTAGSAWCNVPTTTDESGDTIYAGKGSSMNAQKYASGCLEDQQGNTPPPSLPALPTESPTDSPSDSPTNQPTTPPPTTAAPTTYSPVPAPKSFGGLNHVTGVACNPTRGWVYSDYTSNTGGQDMHFVNRNTGAVSTYGAHGHAYGGFPMTFVGDNLVRTQPSTTYDWSNLNQIRVSAFNSPDSYSTYNTGVPSGIGGLCYNGNNVFALRYQQSGSDPVIYRLSTSYQHTHTFTSANFGSSGNCPSGQVPSGLACSGSDFWVMCYSASTSSLRKYQLSVSAQVHTFTHTSGCNMAGVLLGNSNFHPQGMCYDSPTQKLALALQGQNSMQFINPTNCQGSQ